MIDPQHQDPRHHDWQGYLICEAALAAAEADCGLVPPEAARAIIETAELRRMDLAYLAEQGARTRHAMMPVIRALSRAVGGDAAAWVHWGATTQNIRQSADMLQLRGFHRWLCSELAQMLRRLAALADEHRDTLCAGRTHGQHAVPSTFGHLVAAWLSGAEQLARHLLGSGEEALRVQLGGAVGTLASFGPQGLAVMQRFATHLALPPEPMPDRCLHQAVDRYGLALGQLGTFAQQIATGLLLGMRSEQAELVEGFAAGVVGSSTMPQKVNPKDSQDVQILGARLAHNASAHLTHPAAWESGDRAVRSVVYQVLADSRAFCAELLPTLRRLLDNLVVRGERMRHNLDAGGGWLMSERVMLALAEHLGRQEAHDRMHHLSALASEYSLAEALQRELGDIFDQAAIDELCDPAGYLGASAQLIDGCLERAAATVASLESLAQQPIDTPDPLIAQRLRAYTDDTVRLLLGSTG